MTHGDTKECKLTSLKAFFCSKMSFLRSLNQSLLFCEFATNLCTSCGVPSTNAAHNRKQPTATNTSNTMYTTRELKRPFTGQCHHKGVYWDTVTGGQALLIDS